MTKKIILWFLLLIIIAIGVVSYIGYRSFNTEAFKNQIIQAVKDVTGRDMAVKGEAQLTWDPLPTMTLSDVTLSNIPDSTNKEMMKADKIQIQIEWASLFKSPARIKNIILINPRFLIERIGLSVTNLDFPILFAGTDEIQSDPLLGQRRHATQIDNIQIDRGTIQYMNQMTAQSFKITDLTGRIAFGSMGGPFAFEGTGTIGKLPVQITSKIGERAISKPTEFVTDIVHKESKTSITLNGKLYPDEPQKQMTGHLAFKTDSPNTLLKTLGLPILDSKENKPILANGLLDMNPADTSLKDFILRIGDKETDTALSMSLTYVNANKSQQLDLVATELDMAHWRIPLLNLLKSPALGTLPPTTIVVSVSKLLWNNQIASSFQLNGLYEKGIFKIQDSSVLLPGATTITASASLTPTSNQINGSAEINFQTQSLRSVLSFFDIKEIPIPEDKQLFGPTRLKTKLQWQPGSWKVEIPEFFLDKSNGLLHAENPGNRTPLKISTEISNLNWNDYFPQIKTTTQESLGNFITQTLEHLSTLQLPKRPLDIEATLNNTYIRQLSLSNAVVTAQTTQNSIILEAAANTTTSDEIVLQTTIQNIGTPNWNIPKNLWKASGKNLSELLAKVGIKTNAILLQNAHTFEVTANTTGNLKEWQTALNYTNQAMKLELNGSLVDNNMKNMKWNLSHKNTPQFFTQIGIQPVFPKTGGDFNFSAVINQINDNYRMANLVIQADGQRLTGSANFNTKTNRLSGSLRSTHLDLTKLLPDMNHFYLTATGFDGNPFDFDFLSKMSGSLSITSKEITYQTLELKNAKLSLQLDNKILKLNDFVAAGAGNTPSTIQMRGDLNWSTKPVLNLTLVTQDLPMNAPRMMFDSVGFNGGILTSNWKFSTSGDTPLEMARALSASGHVKLNHFNWNGTDIPAATAQIRQASENRQVPADFDQQLKHTLITGSSPIISLEGDFTIHDGLWQMANGVLSATNAKAEGITIDWDIPTNMVKAKLPLKLSVFPSFPAIVYDFINGKRGVEYTLDTKPYVRALEQEFVKQKARQQAAEVAEKKQAIEQEFITTKEKAEKAWQELDTKINALSQQLLKSPNVSAQKELKATQTVQTALKPVMNQLEPMTTLQYQQVLRQITEAEKHIQKAESTILNNQIQSIELEAANKLPPVNDMLLKMNEMYQKRPSLSLLADLIQNSENQRAIIERSIKQFKKSLTLKQVQGVAQIIQQAHDKVAKAYAYAQELYSGRQSTGTNKIIRNTP